jgi:hypothetical protein
LRVTSSGFGGCLGGSPRVRLTADPQCRAGEKHEWATF